MSIETLGEAWLFRWRVTARCAFGNRDGLKIHSAVRLSRRTRHADARMDPRAELPALALGKPAHVPRVRIAARVAALRRPQGAGSRAGEEGDGTVSAPL